MPERRSCSVCTASLTRRLAAPACCKPEVGLGRGRYHLSLFYTEKEIGMAYSWITAGTALSQVLPWLGALPRPCNTCSRIRTRQATSELEHPEK